VSEFLVAGNADPSWGGLVHSTIGGASRASKRGSVGQSEYFNPFSAAARALAGVVACLKVFFESVDIHGNRQTDLPTDNEVSKV